MAFLLLEHWPTSPLSRAWTRVKVILKEGFWLGQWKNIFLHRTPQGSERITQGLKNALRATGTAFYDDRKDLDKCDTVVVLRDVRNLRWALKQKKAGKIKKLLAGPFVATLPTEYQSILQSPEIDGLIFLSQWHRDLFINLCPNLKTKTYTWFSGVDEKKWTPSRENARSEILIYHKAVPQELYEHIKNWLLQKKIPFRVIHYGHYTPEEYQAALERAPFVIFLSQSETQGLALFEAWSMNRPTLVWNPGTMNFLGASYQNASSCPYLEPSFGASFRNFAEFESEFEKIFKTWTGYNPRSQIISKYTWPHSVERFKEMV